MNRTLSFAALFALALVMVSCSQQQMAPNATGPARITVVGGDTVDWGSVAPGQLTRRVVIKNTGGDTLNISNVHPSCGCTTAPISRTLLAAGDTASMDVSIDMNGKQGPQHKTITITSNDSTRENVIVTLMADVQQEMVVEPNFFPVGTDVAINTEFDTEVMVKNTGKEPLTIQPPTVLSTKDMKVRFDLTTATQIPPGQSQRLAAHVTPLTDGTLQNNVVIQTSSKSMPEVQVPLYVTAKAK